MERYCQNFPNDAEKWEDVVKDMPHLPFRCVDVLGQGANCSVHSLSPDSDSESDSVSCTDSESDSESDSGDWVADYFGPGDVKTEDESTGSVDDESMEMESEGEPHTCLTTPSPMGPVEVVAKKFRNIDLDVCYIGQWSDGSRASLYNDPHKYLEWLRGQKNVTTTIAKKHISPTKACYSEFVSESLCHLLLTDLVASGITPHVVMAFRALNHKRDGYLIQERISSNIDEALEENPKLTCRDICAMYLQVFVTLHTLQQACGFKHHDLHLNNVFLKRIDGSMTWNGVKLKDATHFSYKLGDRVLTIPNCGYIVKIGDFGMSSLNIYGRRIQRLSLDCYKSSPSWGEFSADLDGGCGYDGQVLMGDVPFDLTSWRVHDYDTRAFMKRLRSAAQGPNGKLTHERQRPAIGCVSDVPPLDVVKQVFLTDPQPVYDFRTEPTDATIVCLTSC